jgi:hypothetical protein
MGSLAEELNVGSGEALGLTEEEIRIVVDDQEVDRLPGRYLEFLRLMGRKAGRLLVGTDAFYPGILGLKRDAREILMDNGVTELLPEESIVFAMHQGYQIYWMASGALDDPPVFMYQEGGEGVFREWESFTAFLLHEMSRL